MTSYTSDSVRGIPLATGPTIRASHTQPCGWCTGEVAASEPITYTAESGWCHHSCTTEDIGPPT